jgi:hypothetical protein
VDPGGQAGATLDPAFLPRFRCVEERVESG